MKKTSIHEELKVLEATNYQSLDEKRITIDAWLVNKIAELQEQIDNLISKPLCWQTDCKNTEAIIAPHIHTEQDPRPALEKASGEFLKKYKQNLAEQDQEAWTEKDYQEHKEALKNMAGEQDRGHIETEV